MVIPGHFLGPRKTRRGEARLSPTARAGSAVNLGVRFLNKMDRLYHLFKEPHVTGKQYKINCKYLQVQLIL